MKVIKVLIVVTVSIIAVESLLFACPTCVSLNEKNAINQTQGHSDTVQLGEMENSLNTNPASTNKSPETIKKIMSFLRTQNKDSESDDSNPVQDEIDSEDNEPLKSLQNEN